MNAFLQALGLLTALPVRARPDAALEQAPGRAMWAYPYVGAAIGLALAGLAALLRWAGVAASAGLLAAGLVLAAWCAVTGALHLDGWIDCCDALFVPVTRERRLEILKDPRMGSFGGVGLALLLLLKLGAIQAILGAGALSAPVWRWGWVLLAAPVVARWGMVWCALAYPLARPDGMAAYFRRGLGRRELVVGGVAAIAAMALGGWAGLAAAAAGLLAGFGLARLATGRLGGLTGDVYGAVVELSETVMLVAACLMARG